LNTVKNISVVFIVLLSTVFQATAQSKRETLEKQRQQKVKELKQINALLFTNQKKEKSVISRIEDLDAKLSVRQNLIEITNEQANLLTREINTNQNKITDLRTQLGTLKDDYAAMLLKSYKSKSKQSKVLFLLSSDNFKQAYKRLQYMKQYTNYQKEQGEIIKQKTKDLQALNLELSKQKKEKQQLVAENKKAKIQLEEERKNRETLIASIRANMSTFNAQIKKKRQEISRIDQQIDRLIKEAIAAANKKAGKKSTTGKFVLTPEAKKLATEFATNKGKLGWPVTRGIVKGKFGKRRSLTDNSITQNYKGIYIATEKDASVKAIFNGEVTAIQKIKNANPAVMVRHGDYLTVYINITKIKVKKGDRIKTGQVIGEVFTNKIAGETLLDFRIYKNEKALNPELWLVRN